MRLVVTCGPSYEPVDQARRLTNFSTGGLGVALSNCFTDAGHEVWCLKGEGATHPGIVKTPELQSFSTNDDLAARLQEIARGREMDAIFHAAALCDYRVEAVRNEAGESMTSPKFATREGRLHLVLGPATKILPRLRDWFPGALIVGWKYELAGTTADAMARAWRQIRECRTDACVVNGAAYGPGFALCHDGDQVIPCRDAATLGRVLMDWLTAARPARPG